MALRRRIVAKMTLGSAGFLLGVFVQFKASEDFIVFKYSQYSFSQTFI